MPGHQIESTAAVSVEIGNRHEWERVFRLVHRTRQLPEEDTHFLPPWMEEAQLKGAVMVSQGQILEVEKEKEETVVLEPESRCEETKAEEDVHAVVEDGLRQ